MPAVIIPADLPARLSSKIIVDSHGCWLWQGVINNRGYGTTGRHTYVHRLTYELLVGPIPAGLTLDHLCRVRHCVCPSHLDPVTLRVNQLRGQSPAAINARRTHCLHGHALADTNLFIDRHGRRHCKRCRADRMAKYKAARR